MMQNATTLERFNRNLRTCEKAGPPPAPRNHAQQRRTPGKYCSKCLTFRARRRIIMRVRACHTSRRILAWSLLLSIVVSSCARSHEETISGVKVPVPNGLTRTTEKPAELSMFGISAGSASFVGQKDVNEIVEFYKEEMPARGWQPHMNLLSGGAMLAYSKDGQSVLISIGRSNEGARLTLTVSGVKP